MATRTYCDGCGKHMGTKMEPNWWQCTLMGDLLIGSEGRILDDTGLQDVSRQPIRNADMCKACMSMRQEENNG